MNKEKYPENYFIERGMAIGIIFGPAFGILLMSITGKEGLLGMGLSLGILFGLMFGSILEEKYKREGKIEPLNKEEQNQKKGVIIGIIVLVVSISLFVALLWL